MIKRLLSWLWCPGPCIFEIYATVSLWSKLEDTIPSGHKIITMCKTCGTIRCKRT